jgi:hypothetical protein
MEKFVNQNGQRKKNSGHNFKLMRRKAFPNRPAKLDHAHELLIHFVPLNKWPGHLFGHIKKSLDSVIKSFIVSETNGPEIHQAARNQIMINYPRFHMYLSLYTRLDNNAGGK